jgi:2-iminobutanoate/2-iminopropanoate deaminase
MTQARDQRRRIVASGGPPPSGGYSQAIEIEGLLFLSGQAPLDARGSFVGGSVADQVRRTLQNLDVVARAAGSSLSRAARVGVYLRDLADFAEMDAAYREFFGDEAILPARTTIQSDLVGFDVEIDAVVAAGSGDT